MRLPKSFPQIRYFADFSPGTGYNTATRGVLQMLRSLGLGPDKVLAVPLAQIRTSAGDVDAGDWTMPYIHSVEVREDLGSNINIVHTGPLDVGNYWTANRYNIAITAWETDRLPELPIIDQLTGKAHSVAWHLSRFDQVWVPSLWNAATLGHCGVDPHDGIHVIPHVLLDELMNVPPQPLAGDEHQQHSTVFLSVASWCVRKNITGLLQAYWTTGWNPLSGVNLQLHCAPATRDPFQAQVQANRAHNEYRALLEMTPDSMSLPTCSGPQVLHVRYGKLLELYQQSDVFVSASHGEGFCVPILEALAMGRWVIAGGPWVAEFLPSAGALQDGGLIDELKVAPTAVPPIPDVRGYELGHKWWSCKIEDLAEAMQAARDALREGSTDTVARAMAVRAAFSTERWAPKVAELLGLGAERLSRSGW